MMPPRSSLWVLAAAGLVSCDLFPALGVDLDSNSSEGHRDESGIHDSESDRHARSAPRPPPSGILPTPQGSSAHDDEHQFQADWHGEHARQHAEAARLIEGIEASECAELPEPTRSICPLTASVGKFESTADGITLELFDKTQLENTLQRMRCHQAFGRRLGYPQMPKCPLYLPYVQVGVTSDGRISLSSTNPELTPAARIRNVLPAPLTE